LCGFSESKCPAGRAQVLDIYGALPRLGTVDIKIGPLATPKPGILSAFLSSHKIDQMVFAVEKSGYYKQ
jgi:hypothetical protein